MLWKYSISNKYESSKKSTSFVFSRISDSLFIWLSGKNVAFEEATDEQANLTVNEILTNVEQNQKKLKDYSYTEFTAIYTNREKSESKEKIIYKQPNWIKKIIKFEVAGSEREYISISDGEFEWAYYSDSNEVLKCELPLSWRLRGSSHIWVIPKLESTWKTIYLDTLLLSSQIDITYSFIIKLCMSLI